jgi:Amt family ammonium transporter
MDALMSKLARMRKFKMLLLAAMVLIPAGLSCAQDAAPAADAAVATIDSGDTAWMLTSTALVLFMTIPGLALFYGGLVRAKNVLSILMQCFAITCMITVMWLIGLYSMAFDTTGMAKGVTDLHSFIGGFAKLFGAGITVGSMAGYLLPADTHAIPESVFFCYQMTFAIITPALIIGAFAERMKFSAMLIFMALWSILVYAPICHMVWSGDGSFLGSTWGALDYAGGTVVHINAGIAALVCALMLGKRKGYPNVPMPPHNLTMTVTGAAMLWVGWFGFNAGSAVAADGRAGMAMLVTQVATAAAALAWMSIEWVKNGKPSVLGIASGAVAGLVAITPASGWVGPMGSLAIGGAAGIACYFGATTLKHAFGYDDSLDVVGVHFVGGTLGALLTGIFAAPLLGGLGTTGDGSGDYSIASQMLAQVVGVAITIGWSGFISVVLLSILKATIGIRVDEESESVGLDQTEHGEAGYNL